MKKFQMIIMGFVLLFAFVQFTDAEACSVFRITAKDGTIVSGRTMEFGHDMGYAMIVVPRNKNFVSPAPGGSTGLKWKTKYGYVANNVLGKEDGISDGLNEAGLSFSLLWYDNDMQWPTVGPQDKSPALANIVFGSWVLGNFSTVQEAAKAIAHVKVFGHKNPEMGGMVIPAHFILYDAKGDCIVIEYEKGELHIYDNPLGIMTNAPNFPWMLTHLRNYVGMTDSMLQPGTFGRQTYNPTGHGSGMFGLPGDITPPSRFVRMAVTTKFADQPDHAEGALNLAQHIVSSLHIIRGMAVDRDRDGKVLASETTQWSTYRDLTNRVYYFRTYDNFNLRKIDLKRLDFNADKIKTIPMFADKEIIVDVTDRGK
jgi:choloylglycine hydrolase